MKHLFFTLLLLATNLSFAKKQIPPTPFCSEMSLLDQAEVLQPRPDGRLLKADYILISKSRRKLYLLNQARIIAEYPVSFGFGFQNGPKERRGDGRTPEGLYSIQLKKSQTAYHKALQISYPNQQDVEYAARRGFQAGSDILIHGFPTRPIDGLIPSIIPGIHSTTDWTQGCVAVTNEEIEQIYNLVGAQTPVEICPL